MADNPHILILGAGFAGVRASLDIRKLLPKAEITLVNNTNYHCFHPDLYELVGAHLEHERRIDFKNISGTVNIPLEKIFKGKKIATKLDIVESIDLEGKVVTLADEKNIAFDYLVIALGSDTNFFGIPGSSEFSHTLQDTADALNIRNDLAELISLKNGQFRIAIAGGGFTGVEVASSLAHYLKYIAKLGNKNNPEIFVIELQNNLLGGMSGWLQEETTQKLKKLGIELVMGRKISSVEKTEILTDQGNIPYDYLIWTTGIKGPGLFNRISGITLSRGGQITVKTDLSIENFSYVFVAGDSAEFINPLTQKPVPKTADTAMQQAGLIATNIYALEKNLPTKPYIFKSWGIIIPVGKEYAISTLFGMQIKGLIAWWLKRFVNLYYLMSILPLIDAIGLWLKNVKVYLNTEI